MILCQCDVFWTLFFFFFFCNSALPNVRIYPLVWGYPNTDLQPFHRPTWTWMQAIKALKDVSLSANTEFVFVTVDLFYYHQGDGEAYSSATLLIPTFPALSLRHQSLTRFGCMLWHSLPLCSAVGCSSFATPDTLALAFFAMYLSSPRSHHNTASTPSRRFHGHSGFQLLNLSISIIRWVRDK